MIQRNVLKYYNVNNGIEIDRNQIKTEIINWKSTKMKTGIILKYQQKWNQTRNNKLK